ncbi:GatB/YqeY domain-containing protein [Candidatus Margulisiibacteriota bacterium]
MIFEKINTGIKDAMKAKDTTRLETLRMMKSKILLVNARGDVKDEEVIKILKTYHKNLKDALEQAGSQKEHVDNLTKEIKIVEEFLPAMLSETDIEKRVKQAIEQTGASSPSDMGKVMGAVMKMSDGIDGKVAKDIAIKLLSK